MHSVNEIAENAGAISVTYAESCESYALAEIRSTNAPGNHKLYARSVELWAARNNVWRDLLAAVNRLSDAGEDAVARNMLLAATDMAQVAEVEAMRRELATMKGAA